MLEIRRTENFARWFRHIKDTEAKARINVRITRLKVAGNYGDAKPVGDGVFEMRIDYGPGYRLYYAHRGQAIVLLLVGGDKSSQHGDIVKAKRLNAEYE